MRLEHIVQWFRHNVRAAQQELKKTNIISKMGVDKTLCTFDWAQKILPQRYREFHPCWAIRLEKDRRLLSQILRQLSYNLQTDLYSGTN